MQNQRAPPEGALLPSAVPNGTTGMNQRDVSAMNLSSDHVPVPVIPSTARSPRATAPCTATAPTQASCTATAPTQAPCTATTPTQAPCTVTALATTSYATASPTQTPGPSTAAVTITLNKWSRLVQRHQCVPRLQELGACPPLQVFAARCRHACQQPCLGLQADVYAGCMQCA